MISFIRSSSLDPIQAHHKTATAEEHYFSRLGLGISVSSITVCPEIPSPKTPSLTTDQWDREQNSGENPEFRPDPKSSKLFDKIDDSSDWRLISKEIQARLKLRGINKDVDYISDHLSAYANEIQDENDAEAEAERLAEIAEFNLHIGKLKQKYAAVLLLRNCHHLSFMDIAKTLNISDEQAGNEFRDAEKYFNSDLIQVDFIGHEITMNTPVDELIEVLVAGARAVKSPAGRKPKPKNTPKSQNGDLFWEDA
ncbi:hypothetical protein GL267_002955 [Acidithiobacillus ferrianus]|uniref:Uncharacterized protein n=2 Tax=Acidithiobacillus ferrianus TaxID=2678518 RepID=A0A845UB27_9PROT|nr:hypothetical protein [Acidithiobacillus ferrianus]NDU43369.1 hypothetical protein [Acidithiobacillus ferrianus]